MKAPIPPNVVIYFKPGEQELGTWCAFPTAHVLAMIAKHFEMPVAEIQGSSRIKKIIDVRFMVILFFRRRTKLTMNELGGLLNRHHSSISIAVQQIKIRLSLYPADKRRYEVAENYMMRTLRGMGEQRKGTPAVKIKTTAIMLETPRVAFLKRSLAEATISFSRWRSVAARERLQALKYELWSLGWGWDYDYYIKTSDFIPSVTKV